MAKTKSKAKSSKSDKSKKNKSPQKHFDPRDFFPHMETVIADESVPVWPYDPEEFARKQSKAANPAYWMHMGQLMAQSSVSAPWLWYGMMLGTMEAMKVSAKSSDKIERRHREAIEAIRKFTRHVAGADAVKPPKSKKAKQASNFAAETAPVEPEVVDAEDNATSPVGLLNMEAESAPVAADDLKMISGVGPQIEEILNGLGVHNFSQIAAWTATEVEWFEEYLQFPGRIERDNWIEQAKALAKGGRDEYVKVFGKEPR